MVQRLVVVLLVLMVVFVGCGEDEPEISSVEDLKDTDAKNIIWEKDGKEMVLIPAGSFEMGDSKNDPEDWMGSSRPVHTVQLEAFYMDVHEVTVGQFRAFLADSDYSWSGSWDEVDQYSTSDNQPMVLVAWNDAKAYCEWAGKRLPTEAEWEYAARGGLNGKRYPWGDEETDGSQCNFADKNASFDWANVDVDDGYARCSPVGSYSPNGYGLYDMVGNVYEWCSDWYDAYYYSRSPLLNPQGPGSTAGSKRVLRGGSCRSATIYLRVANRYYLDPIQNVARVEYPFIDYGFRCVADIK